MIIALSLNPCLDKTVGLPKFRIDAPNRVTAERVDIGGKGVNVARVCRELGAETLLMGFDYSGRPVEGAMAREGVPCRLLAVDGALRVNMKLRETDTGRTIEINEQGAFVPKEALDRMLNAVLDALRPGDWASLSGSLPPGAGKDTYRRFCAAIQEKGCFAAADCDGEALREVLEARPALVKPNAWEFAALTGIDPRDTGAMLAACRRMLKAGVGKICLSRGGEGAWLVTPEGAWSCPAAPVQAQGTQGAGDSMLAALLTAFSRGLPNPEALRFASAAAAASVALPGTLLCTRAQAEALLPALAVTALPM